MAQKAARKAPPKPKPQPKPKKEPKPNFPQHRFGEPYARLMTLGKGDYDAVYEQVAAQLKAKDANAAVKQLIEMALDETYYEYWDEDEDDESEGDPRSWTCLHALRVLERMGPAAAAAAKPLLPLLEYLDDDYVIEEIPQVYAAIGEPAIELLAGVLLNPEGERSQRLHAGESLAEIGEAHEDLRPRIIKLLEQALDMQTDNPELAGFLITNLMDVGAQESVPLIELMFREERVDLMVVQMSDVEEHFDLPRVTPRKDWRTLHPELWAGLFSDADEDGDEEAGFEDYAEEMGLTEDEDGDEVQIPYVAPPKVGRNEPCPCGSGKKYKKCCGA